MTALVLPVYIRKRQVPWFSDIHTIPRTFFTLFLSIADICPVTSIWRNFLAKQSHVLLQLGRFRFMTAICGSCNAVFDESAFNTETTYPTFVALLFLKKKENWIFNGILMKTWFLVIYGIVDEHAWQILPRNRAWSWTNEFSIKHAHLTTPQLARKGQLHISSFKDTKKTKK